MTGFFPEPLKLQDYPRASSALPSPPTVPLSSSRDSPSPNKKRRVESVPPAGGSAAKNTAKPKSSASTSSSRNARIAEEEALLTSRLHSTLRLRDAWADILRRHSLPPPPPISSSSSFSLAPPSFSSSASSAQSRRHNPAGWTRALPVEEDDIIDLSTMEIVQDRGVLRGSRAGAFAIGGYSGASDDILVGADSGAAAGDEEGEEEEEDEEVDWEELEGAEGSDDELGVMDDLQSLPSLLFREERRKDEERKKELQDFWEHESRSRGQTETPQREEGDAVAHGNVRLATPVVAGDEDDLDLFTAPEARPRAVTAPLATPSRSPVASTSKLPPSTTAALRKMVQATTLSSSPPPHSSSSPSVKCTSKRKAKPPSTSRREVSVSPSSSRAQSKPRSKSSPLKNVITIPSRSPSPELGVSRPLRAISPELGVFAPPPPAAAIFQRPTPTPTPPPSFAPSAPPLRAATAPPAKLVKRRTQSFELIFERPTRVKKRTPVKPASTTPAPVLSQPSPAPVGAQATPQKETTARKRRSPPTIKKNPLPLPRSPPTKQSLPTSDVTHSSPAPPSERSMEKPKAKKIVLELRGESEDEEEEERRRFATGLSTPPLSKGTSRRFSASKSVPPRSVSTPPGAVAASKKRRQAAEEEEDPLLLSSPAKLVAVSPVKAGTPRMSLPPQQLLLPPSPPSSPTFTVVVSSPAALSRHPHLPALRADHHPPLPIVARPLPFTPRRTAHLIHLLLALSTTSHLVTVVLFLLSPYDLPLLVLRLFLQLQLTNPRRTHPTRSLALFLGVLWLPINAIGIVWHAALGSRGTKGVKGWAQGGMMLDFVGQAATPSKTHLLILDVLLAILQLATLIVAFGATVPSDIDGAAGAEGEAGREYGNLLGEESEEWGDEGETQEALRRRPGRMGGYVAVEEEEEEDEMDNFPFGSSPNFASSSSYPSKASTSSSSASHVRLTPIADIRFRTLLKEITRGAEASKREGAERRALDVEEGRVEGEADDVL